TVMVQIMTFMGLVCNNNWLGVATAAVVAVTAAAAIDCGEEGEEFGRWRDLGVVCVTPRFCP
ncbi:MAG: hypothetical protein Q8877_03020, partial [Sweet potato little leaf phytoplasma]|nr:hypothetical protein [Sweet potato little leaf phytoplasma]